LKIKNILVLLLSLALFFALLSGCSSNKNNTNSSQSFNQNGNGRGNFKTPGLTGQVSNVKGNDMTLNLIAIPQRGGTRSRRSYQSGGNGGNGGGQYQSGQSRPQRTINFTGEVKDFVIPSGTKLVTMSFSQGGISESTVTLDSIKVDDTLSVYYTADGKTIDYISVSDSSSGGGFGGGLGGGYGGGN
jgi:hypothetical protein